MYCFNILAVDFMILDLICVLSTVLIFVLFYFHLYAFVLPASTTVFSLSDSLSKITNLLILIKV